MSKPFYEQFMHELYVKYYKERRSHRHQDKERMKLKALIKRRKLKGYKIGRQNGRIKARRLEC